MRLLSFSARSELPNAWTRSKHLAVLPIKAQCVIGYDEGNFLALVP